MSPEIKKIKQFPKIKGQIRKIRKLPLDLEFTRSNFFTKVADKEEEFVL